MLLLQSCLSCQCLSLGDGRGRCSRGWTTDKKFRDEEREECEDEEEEKCEAEAEG